MENMDWGALGFDYRKTDANVRYYYTDGKWSEMEVTGDEYIKIHGCSLRRNVFAFPSRRSK